MKLTETQIRVAKPREKPYKLPDGGGLVLLVQPSGAKWWRVRYRVAGVEKMLSVGTWPEVSLKDAREWLTGLRKELEASGDPAVSRRIEKEKDVYTFAIVAREWLASQKEFMSPATYRKARWILEDLCGPCLGTQPIAHITSAEVLKVLEDVDKRGHGETARRIRQRVGAVMRYAIVREYAERHVTVVLRDALRPKRVEHHAAITEPERIGELLRAIHAYQGNTVTAAALKLAPLLYVRPGELRAAQWLEIDLARASIHRLGQLGAFPQRRRISMHSVRWVESELAEWIAARPAVPSSYGGATSEHSIETPLTRRAAARASLKSEPSSRRSPQR